MAKDPQKLVDDIASEENKADREIIPNAIKGVKDLVYKVQKWNADNADFADDRSTAAPAKRPPPGNCPE